MIYRLTRWLLSFCISQWPLVCLSQGLPLPMHRLYTNAVEGAWANPDSIQISSFKPYFQANTPLRIIPGFEKDSTKYYYDFETLLFRDHLIDYRHDDFHITIDPLYNISLGHDFADTTAYGDTARIYTNTRGLLLQVEAGNKVSFQTGFYENQSFFPAYLRDITLSNSAVPGSGRVKKYKNIYGFDYAMSFGTLNIVLPARINFQMAYDRLFIGNGYRSLFLSDANFPYAQVRLQWKSKNNRVQYHFIAADLQSLQRRPQGETPEALFQNKAASFHYLAFIPIKFLELGLFEGTIWQRWDSTGTRPLPWNAFVPLPGFSTATNGFGDKNNVLLGLNMLMKPIRHVLLYGQYAVSGSGQNHSGIQGGMHVFDLPIKGLDLQIEYNTAGKSLYTNGLPLQSWDHYNQPLGTAAGQGSKELIAIAGYHYKRWQGQVKFNNIRRSLSPQVPTNYYSQAPDIQQIDLRAGWQINPKTNSQIGAMLTIREESFIMGSNRNTLYFSVFVRTFIHNQYFDF